MNVEQLIDCLNKLPKDLEIRVLIPELNTTDEENFWLEATEVSYKGESGYEIDGEVRLIGRA